VPYRLPRNLRVKPPVPKDAAAGFILSRALEINGRPIAFAFTSTPPDPDGAEVFLGSSLLRRSLNYRSLAAGQAYPLFYDTLFADLRGVFTQAAATARQAGAGLWAQDHSQTGLAVTSQAALEQQGSCSRSCFAACRSSWPSRSPADWRGSCHGWRPARSRSLT
jgi:hypothetical protein